MNFIQQAQAISVNTKLLKVMLQWNVNVKACIVQEIINKAALKICQYFSVTNAIITACNVELRPVSQRKNALWNKLSKNCSTKT